MIRNIKLFAITTISTLLLGSVLNAQIIDAKQLFNKKLIKVQSEEISLSKSYYGITKIDESSQVDIVSRFDGYITKLNANKAYMNIRKGEALYSIYSEDILSIQSELELAKDFNKNIYNSTLMRLDNLGISISEQDKIKKNKLNSNGIMVTSPINGILLQRNINNLSAIKKGNTLLSLASLDKIWFIISVYQNDLAFIKKDMKAKINIDGQSNNINSTVDFIYPTFDEKTKTVDVRFIIDNKNQELIPSMFGKANIQVNKRLMLTLPKTAVLKKANNFYVFKPINDSEFEPIKINAKRITSNKYEILGGLEQNDEVINNTLFLLDSDALTNSLYESDDEDW